MITICHTNSPEIEQASSGFKTTLPTTRMLRRYPTSPPAPPSDRGPTPKAASPAIYSTTGWHHSSSHSTSRTAASPKTAPICGSTAPILREATLTRAEASASTTYMRSSCGGFQKLSSAMPHRWSAQAESTGVGSTLSTDEDQVQMTRQRLSMPSPRKSTG